MPVSLGSDGSSEGQTKGISSESTILLHQGKHEPEAGKRNKRSSQGLSLDGKQGWAVLGSKGGRVLVCLAVIIAERSTEPCHSEVTRRVSRTFRAGYNTEVNPPHRGFLLYVASSHILASYKVSVGPCTYVNSYQEHQTHIKSP